MQMRTPPLSTICSGPVIDYCVCQEAPCKSNAGDSAIKKKKKTLFWASCKVEVLGRVYDRAVEIKLNIFVCNDHAE